MTDTTEVHISKYPVLAALQASARALNDEYMRSDLTAFERQEAWEAYVAIDNAICDYIHIGHGDWSPVCPYNVGRDPETAQEAADMVADRVKAGRRRSAARKAAATRSARKAVA